jgi:hypothetical protein
MGTCLQGHPTEGQHAVGEGADVAKGPIGTVRELDHDGGVPVAAAARDGSANPSHVQLGKALVQVSAETDWLP